MKNTTYINAGAGSGKTYTLTNLLAEKLSKGEVEPSQVILTTFTELAAAEFREKARVQILDKGNLEAAAQMDSAAIGTVHSVALHFIKKFWYLLDYGADIQTISERDEQYYLNQSLARIMNETDSSEKLKVQQHLDHFKRFRKCYNICDSNGNPDHLFWQQYLKDVVEKMEYYNVNSIQTSVDKSMETLKAVFNKKTNPNIKDQLLADLKAYYQYIRVIDQKNAIEQSQAIAPLLNSCNDAMELLPLASALKKPIGGSTKIDKNCPEYSSFMSKLAELPASEVNIQILEPFIKSIFELSQEWRNDYINFKKKNQLISYNDMEQLFLKLLTDEQEVQDYVSSHYRLVMVDEFQDSNPIQLKIFNRLSELIAQGGGHSYWVGDPKQAIYGFRGSDTELVNSVAKRFKFYDDNAIHPEEGPDKLGTGRLTQSWRSRPQLVKLVNETFYESFKNDGINELLIKLDPHFGNDSLTYPAIAHYECSETNVDAAAMALANRVKLLLQSKMKVHKGSLDQAPSEISPRDIAVLCRTNDKAKTIVKSLRSLHIPVSESEDAIMQRIEVQLVITLLQFLQNPNNMHIRADLMRLLWGKTTEEILKDRIDYVQQQNPTDQWQDDIVSRLLKQSERYKHLSIPEMVSGLIYECDIPALTARWGDAHIRQQNLSTLQHLADDYDQMCLQMGQGSSISGFINYLNSNEPDKEKDNQSDTVKVFTYHGAKGLEWPVVIMHGLDKEALEPQDFTKKTIMSVREMILQDNSSIADPFNKEYYLHFFPYILKDHNYQTPVPPMVLDNLVSQQIYKTLHSKMASEERRLLYVGMTRAKDQLISFGYQGKYNWLINAGVNTPSAENVWGKEEFKPHQLVSTALPVNDDANASETYSMTEKPTTHTSFCKRYLSPSKLDSIDGYKAHQAWQEKGTEISSKGWGNDYATVGSCIHDIFAVYRQGQADANKETALRIIGGYGLAGQLAGHVDTIIRSADWLYEQLQKRFPQQEGDGIDREYPFQMTLPNGQTLRGEMDLLWYYSDAQGKHCVLVDYKSFQGVDLHAYTQKRNAQLSAYASSLTNAGVDLTHTLLYYPVHGVIHELQ